MKPKNDFPKNLNECWVLDHTVISIRSFFRVTFSCVDKAACKSLLPVDNLNDKITVWLLNVTSNLCQKQKNQTEKKRQKWERIKIRNLKWCWWTVSYSESMQMSGCLPVAFWMTRNNFVMTSITCVVWNTKSPFFWLISDCENDSNVEIQENTCNNNWI